MISSGEGEFGLVEELMEKKGLDSKNSQMIVGKLKSIVKSALGQKYLKNLAWYHAKKLLVPIIGIHVIRNMQWQTHKK